MKFGQGQYALAEPDEPIVKVYRPPMRIATMQRLGNFNASASRGVSLDDGQFVTMQHDGDFKGLGRGQTAIEAAEKYVINTYMSLTRATTSQWGWASKDLSRLRYKERLGQKGASLMVSIKGSRIIEHVTLPEEQWIIQVVPDIGIELEPEEYIVYQEEGGSWIVALWR